MDDVSTVSALQAHMDANWRAGTIARGDAVVGAWFVGRLSPTPVPGRHAATVVAACRKGERGCVSAVIRQRAGMVDPIDVARALLAGHEVSGQVRSGEVEPEEDGFGAIVGVMDALATERAGRRRISLYLVEHAVRSCARVRGDMADVEVRAGVDAHLAAMGAAVRPFLDTLDRAALAAVRGADAFDAVGDMWPALDPTFGPAHGPLEATLREAPGMVTTLVRAHEADRRAFEALAATGGTGAVLSAWLRRSLPGHVADLHVDAGRALSSLDPDAWDRVGRALDGVDPAGPRYEKLLRVAAGLPAHAMPRGEAQWAAFASVADTLVAARYQDAAGAAPGPGDSWPEWAARLRDAGGPDPVRDVWELGRMSYALSRQVVWPVVSGSDGVSIKVATDLAHEALFSGLDLPARLAALRRWQVDPLVSRAADSRSRGDWTGYLREPWASLGPAGWREAALARGGIRSGNPPPAADQSLA